ncbi:MAG: YeeE/YedE thiosulfate transporter family protein [Luteolibacter sp.]
MENYYGALIGGILIGLGSLLAMMGSGKVPGISGVAGRLLRRNPGDTLWRVMFMAALIAGAGLALAMGLGWQGYSLPQGRSLVIYGIAGLLVGFGTRMGGGCTSGHGVCGMGSGAKDGMLYTVIFMLTAIITVFLWNLIAGGVA